MKDVRNIRTMQNKNRIIYITGYIAVAILGTLLHFVYEWSGSNMIVGLFSSTNESTWEHMKLAFYPMLIFSIIFMILYMKYSALTPHSRI